MSTVFLVVFGETQGIQMQILTVFYFFTLGTSLLVKRSEQSKQKLEINQNREIKQVSSLASEIPKVNQLYKKV